MRYPSTVGTIWKLHFHRFSSTPLECSGCLTEYNRGTQQWTFYGNHQMPGVGAIWMAPALRVGIDKLRFVSQDIGGAFGNKICLHPYYVACALLARKLNRPIQWTEWRTDQHMANAHGNERTFLDVEVPVQRDGTILGFRFRAFDDAGAYLHYEPLGAIIWAQALVGCYRFKHIGVDYSSVVTNKLPVCPNRGYSRMQHQWLVERIVDIVAQELDFDPIELRKHNFIKPDEYPYELPNGCVYDSGDLPLTLDKALALIDYPAWRARQQAAPDGVRIGIGIGSALDSGTSNFDQSRIINPMMNLSGNAEAAIVKLGVFGEVSIALGSVPQGQSHETTAAQVAADVLGVGVDDIDVTVGFRSLQNTATVVSGTYASQFAVTGLCAVLGAADMLKTEICRIAAFALEADPGDIELVGGMARVAGDPDREIPFAGVANMVHANMLALPKELAGSVSLVCRYVYRPDLERIDPERKYGRLAYTYASQIHACVVEVDEATGQVKVVDYGAVDDCGVRINPQVIEGQVHGAAAHGVGGALFETFAYDADGQLPNATFFDYHIPTAADLPDIKTDDVVSPSPMSPNGAKGMGEGGGAALYAVGAAIQDALRGTGAAITQSHIPPDLVHALLHGEQTERSRVEVESR